MRLALCNEVLAAMPLERQCEHAAALGYDGLEIAPYTLFDRPDEVTANEASRARNVVESAGLAVTSLHWLLARPAGLSLTDPDASTRSRTLEVMTRLTGLCAALGANVRSEEHTSELQTRPHRVCRLLLQNKKEPKSLGPGMAPHEYTRLSQRDFGPS